MNKYIIKDVLKQAVLGSILSAVFIVSSFLVSLMYAFMLPISPNNVFKIMLIFAVIDIVFFLLCLLISFKKNNVKYKNLFLILGFIFFSAGVFPISSTIDLYLTFIVIGFALFLFFLYISFKVMYVEYKNVFLILSFIILGILTINALTEYALMRIQPNVEEGLVHLIIIGYMYFTFLSLSCYLIFTYTNRYSQYFNKYTCIKDKIKYAILYYAFAFIPILLCYIFLLQQPVLFLFIWLCTTIVLILITGFKRIIKRYFNELFCNNLY